MGPNEDSTISMSENAGCQYCVVLKEVNEPIEGNCPYCVDMENGDAAAALENCKYCADSPTPGNNCQYCSRPAVEASIETPVEAMPETQNSTTTDSENFTAQGLDSPAIPKPILGEDIQEQIPPMDETTNNNLAIEGQGESNVQVSSQSEIIPGPMESVQVDQSKEAMQAIAQQIEQEPPIPGAGPGPQGAQIALETDDSMLNPTGPVVDGVSRPEGYDQNTPSDMGLAQENEAETPDLTSVLHEGLDAHADNIQREKVVQMASEALTGFKSCKHIIERSQEQAPQLYKSCILMLRSMIEMAKLLGLGQEMQSQSNPLESQPGNEWQDPFPAHEENGGTPLPGHAPSGDANLVKNPENNEWNNPFSKHAENDENANPIGQSLGKLPTSATTKHVAHPVLAPGEVNALGQKKYVDPKTGKESFIDMKVPRVLNEQGKPVKG